jgi:hypothetical protein
VLQSTSPLQLKAFKVGSKMAIAASAPVLPNQKKTVLQIRPIHWRILYVHCLSRIDSESPPNILHVTVCQYIDGMMTNTKIMRDAVSPTDCVVSIYILRWAVLSPWPRHHVIMICCPVYRWCYRYWLKK